MDPDSWSGVILGGTLGTALVGSLVIAALSSLETAVLTARRSRLSHRAPDDPRVERALLVLESSDLFEATAHLAKSLWEAIVYTSAALAGMQVAVRLRAPQFPPSLPELFLASWPGVILAALGAHLTIALLGEALPKLFAASHPEGILIRFGGVIRACTLLFTPARWMASRLARALALSAGADRLAPRAAHTEEEIKLLVEGSAEEGVLEEEEKEMIHSIFEFTETVARQIMIPRIDVAAINVESSLDDVVRQVLDSGHSRLPVYEGTMDTVVGIIHVKDVLLHLARGDHEVPIRELLRDPFFVPEGKKIDELLQEFRRQRNYLAIVVDEFGGTSGVVTVEDVLEEIVGEIEDEYDLKESTLGLVERQDDGWVVDARMTIDDVNEQLGLAIPRGDYDTLGGFVFSLFGRPPKSGEKVVTDPLIFEAETTDGLRLKRIRITQHRPGISPDT